MHTQSSIYSLSHTHTHTHSHTRLLTHKIKYVFPRFFFLLFNSLYGSLVGSVAFSSCSLPVSTARSAEPCPLDPLPSLSLLLLCWTSSLLVCLEFWSVLLNAKRNSTQSRVWSGSGPNMHVKMQRKSDPRSERDTCERERVGSRRREGKRTASVSGSASMRPSCRCLHS